MSAVNWAEHRARFFEEAAKTGIKLKEYCAINGLNFNSARKHISASQAPSPASETASKKQPKKDSKTRQKSVGKAGDHETDHAGDHANVISLSGAKIRKKANDKASKFTVLDAKSNAYQFRDPPSKNAGNAAGNFQNNSRLDVKRKAGGRGSQKGANREKSQNTPQKNSAKNERSDPDLPDALKPAILPFLKQAQELTAKGPAGHMNALLEMAQANALAYQQAVDYQAAKLRAEIEAEEEEEGPDNWDDDDEERPQRPPAAARLCGLLESSAYFMNDYISRIAAIYQGGEKLNQGALKLTQGAEKLKQAERQQAFREAEAGEKLTLARMQMDIRSREVEHRISQSAREARIIADAIRLREREEIDDIGVAEYIERQGVKVPFTLALIARRAVEAIEPPVEENSIDDDEIEREARLYAEQQQNHPQWLQSRREEVQAITDRLGYGDTDATGERKQGEFDADNTGLVFDEALASQMYDDDNNAYDEIPLDTPVDDE